MSYANDLSAPSPRVGVEQWKQKVIGNGSRELQ